MWQCSGYSCKHVDKAKFQSRIFQSLGQTIWPAQRWTTSSSSASDGTTSRPTWWPASSTWGTRSPLRTWPSPATVKAPRPTRWSCLLAAPISRFIVYNFEAALLSSLGDYTWIKLYIWESCHYFILLHVIPTANRYCIVINFLMILTGSSGRESGQAPHHHFEGCPFPGHNFMTCIALSLCFCISNTPELCGTLLDKLGQIMPLPILYLPFLSTWQPSWSSCMLGRWMWPKISSPSSSRLLRDSR